MVFESNAQDVVRRIEIRNKAHKNSPASGHFVAAYPIRQDFPTEFDDHAQASLDRRLLMLSGVSTTTASAVGEKVRAYICLFSVAFA
jgi:hypothetical protein